MLVGTVAYGCTVLTIDILFGIFGAPRRGFFMIQRVITFLKEVQTELKKVNWLTWQETARYTLIVLGVSIAVAAFLGTVDAVMQQIIQNVVL